MTQYSMKMNTCSEKKNCCTDGLKCLYIMNTSAIVKIVLTVWSNQIITQIKIIVMPFS